VASEGSAARWRRWWRFCWSRPNLGGHAGIEKAHNIFIVEYACGALYFLGARQSFNIEQRPGKKHGEAKTQERRIPPTPVPLPLPPHIPGPIPSPYTAPPQPSTLFSLNIRPTSIASVLPRLIPFPIAFRADDYHSGPPFVALYHLPPPLLPVLCSHTGTFLCPSHPSVFLFLVRMAAGASSNIRRPDSRQ